MWRVLKFNTTFSFYKETDPETCHYLPKVIVINEIKTSKSNNAIFPEVKKKKLWKEYEKFQIFNIHAYAFSDSP